MPIQPGPLLKPEAADALRRLVGHGALPGGVFETDDCRGTYEKLKGRGVEFLNPPEERFYGIEALLKDNSGNWFSMVERPRDTRSRQAVTPTRIPSDA